MKFSNGLTPELTGRAFNETSIQAMRMKDKLIRAPVE
jgi:hypothetical protein